jgi:hypothetical protein
MNARKVIERFVFCLAFAIVARGAYGIRGEDGGGIDLGWCNTHPAACLGGVTVLAPHSTVVGKTIGQWTADWWNWSLSIPGGPNHPWQETTGAAANVNQSGPVFFLAASFNNGGATRTFNVPADKYLLVPLPARWAGSQPYYPQDPPWSNSESECVDLVNHTISPSRMYAYVDGVAVPDLASHREPYPSGARFTLPIIPGNIYGFPAPDPFHPLPVTLTDAYADGYWLMLPPIGHQTHYLTFSGYITAYTPPGGDTWPASAADTSAIVTGVTDPTGDYNHNGKVDAADYTVWRDGLGNKYTQDDYGVWKSQFGKTVPGFSSGATAGVPEPSTFVLLTLAAAGICIRRHRTVTLASRLVNA